MGKVKVIYDKDTCIGVGACCAVCPKYWKMGDDGKAILIGSKFNKNNKKFELIADEKDFECLKNSEEVCPVRAIKVIKED